MNNIKKYIESIHNHLDILSEILKKAKNKDYFLAEHNADELIRETHFNIKQDLNKIFGKESDGNNYGLVNDIFDAHGGSFDKAVLFSYWSFSDKPLNEIKDDDGKWRGNLFYKGNRFSYPNFKSKFYKLFNKVSKDEFVGKQIPIDYFANLSSKSGCSKKHITISNNNHTKTTSNITLPVYNTKLEQDNSFSRIINIINESKHKIIRSTNDENDSVITQELEAVFNDNYKEAQKLFIKENPDLLKRIETSITSLFKGISINNNELFNLIIAYQFYDHDGVIILFLPTEKNHKAVLALLIPEDKINIIEKYENHLNVLINVLKELTVLEKKIWEEVINNFRIKLLWKSYYSEIKYKYNNLANHIIILLDAICKSQDISNHHISYRVKSFESLFARIIDRYNDPTNSQWNIDTDKIDNYKTAVLVPTNNNISDVFDTFWDISATRIVFVFRDDLKKFNHFIMNSEDYFEKEDEEYNVDNELLGINVKYFYYNKKRGYIAHHYKLSLNNKRDLFELRDLMKIKCELQTKTILTHGWSDFDHDLLYKSKLPKTVIDKITDKKDEYKDIGNRIKKTSETLVNIDNDFSKLKKDLKKTIND